MPFQSVAGSAPHVALYRDELMDVKRVDFFWDRFTGMTSRRDDAMVGRDVWPNEVLSSEKPVLIIPQGDGKYRTPGRVNTNRHVMGTKTEYNNAGVAGDAKAKDTGSLDVLNFTELFWHRRRFVKPVRQGKWNEKLGGDWMLQLVVSSGPDLAELWMRHKSMDVFHALYYGHSEHIIYDANIGVGMSTDPAVGGLGETIRMHENFCIPGLAPGRSTGGTRNITWSATHATHMQRIARNLARMTNENQFKCGRYWLGIVAQELKANLKVKKMKHGQPEFWLAVTDAQWLQLTDDDELMSQIIFDNQKAVDQSETYLGNASFRWGGLHVFRGGYRGPTRVYSWKSGDTLSTTNGPGKTTTSGNATRVTFGFVTDALVPYDMADSQYQESASEDDGSQPWLSRDVAIGGAFRPMILGLDIWSPEFLKESDDFGNVTQMCLDVAGGFSRKPRYDKETPAGSSTSVNDTSMLFASYSPNHIIIT